jgi:hypothetical protein
MSKVMGRVGVIADKKILKEDEGKKKSRKPPVLR